MAALIEEVRWRETKRGRRYVSATLSDNSGQFQASCFEEDVCKQIAELGNHGDCALLSVELDRQPGEEVPRVTIRSLQAFAKLASSSRAIFRIDVEDAQAVPAIAQLLSDAKGGRCEVQLRSRLDDGRVVRVRLGWDFAVEAELAARIGAVPGVTYSDLRAAEPLRLAHAS